jgi:prepilin-type N-terminal cleavage/methylation domain-containing protein
MVGRYLLKNQRGYTLIEIIAVLVILSILAAVAVPRFIDLAESARRKALYNLGSEYFWSSGPTPIGGTLDFKDQPMDLDRTPSTYTSAPDWK